MTKLFGESKKKIKEEMKQLKCELCGKEHFILIQVEVATDAFGGRKGICCECFKNGEIEDKIFLKRKKFIEEQIEVAIERKQYWEKNLKELT